MGAVFLSPIYLLLNAYLALRLRRWFATLHPQLSGFVFAALFYLLYVLLALTPLLAVVVSGRAARFVRRISNYWLGILLYLLIFILLTDLGRIVIRLLQRRSVLLPFNDAHYRIAVGAALVAAALVTVYGVRHASLIEKTRYDVTVQKDCEPSSLRIALLADLHLGCNTSLRHLRNIRSTIEGMHPDLVVYAGDIFDNDFDAVPQPKKAASILGGIKSTYGAYACWGNHDVDELILAGFTFDAGKDSATSDPRMHAFLKKAGIRLLEDETVLIADRFYLCGRLDASCKEKSGITRLTPDELLSGLDHTHPILVIDHQPSQLPELSGAGADLVLSGHTHDGQLFPGNLTTRIGWMNSCGSLSLGDMTSIVTSGAGIWGPAMRVGTNSEVVQIDVTFSGR